MESAQPLEDMTEAEIEQWYIDNDMNPKGFIECKSSDALNVLSFMDHSHKIAGEFTVPIDELDDYNAIRRKKSPISIEEEDVYTEEEQNPLKEDALSKELVREIIQIALRQLHPRQQEAVESVIMRGVTKSQTARDMEISRQSVGRLIVKGLRALKEYYEMLGGVDLEDHI